MEVGSVMGCWLFWIFFLLKNTSFSLNNAHIMGKHLISPMVQDHRCDLEDYKMLGEAAHCFTC